MSRRIVAVFLITLLLLLSTAPLLHRVFVTGSTDTQPVDTVTGSTDIQPVTTGALAPPVPCSGPTNHINWHWDSPDNASVNAVSISADGSYVVAWTYSYSFWYKIYLFNKSSSTPVWTFEGGEENVVNSVEISADGNYIAAVGSSVWLFSTSNNTPIWENHTGGLYSVAISYDGSYIAASQYSSNKVFLFSKDSPIPIRTYDIYSPDLVSISADGQYIVVGSWAGGPCYLLDKDYPEPIWVYNVSDVYKVAISADGSHLIAIEPPLGENKLYLFRMEDNSPLWNVSGGRISSGAISSDGSYIVTGIDYPPGNESVRLYSKESSTPLWEFSTEHEHAVYDVDISYDGQYIAAAADNIYLFDKDAGGCPFKNYTPVHYGYAVNYIALSAAADYIVWQDGDGITFYEVELPGKIFTTLTVTPSTFTLDSNDNITLTANLTSQGSPLVGKAISWTTNAGKLSPASGTTDNAGQVSTIYTALSVSTHIEVTVSASFAGDENYKASTDSSSGTINPAGPVSALIESEYNGFFLHNVNAITNTYRVNLSYEENIDRVVFQMGSWEQTVDNTPPYEAAYNMGNVGLNSTLNVTVYLMDNGTVSDSLSPVILQTPTILSQILNFFYATEQVDVYKKPNGCWKMSVLGIVPVVKAAMSVADRVVPFDVGFGDYDLPISDWKLGFTMEGDDYNESITFAAIELSIDNAEIMGFGGLSFNAELSGDFTVRPDGENRITNPTITISVGGEAKFTYYYGIVICGIPITVTVSPYFGAGLGISFGADDPIKMVDVNGSIHGGVKVSAGVGIPGFSAGAYFDGTIYLFFVAVPSFGFERVTVTAEVGLYVEALLWRYYLELWDDSWSSNPGGNESSQLDGEWKLNERNYLGPGYSTFAWTAGNREGILVENVYSNPQPSLAVAENGSMVAAWTYDSPGKSILQALEIAYSVYDPKQRAWSTPATITSDKFFDSNPKLAYIGNGRVLAVWQRVPYQLENTVSPFAFVEDIELAYSILDLNTGGWSTPHLITSNSMYEVPSTLASCGGKTYLVYLRDPDGNLFTLDNQTLVATEWIGGSWGAEEIIASGITVVGSARFSLAGANDGILTFVRDMDENLSTIADREIFYIRYDGNWGIPTRLTTNNISEESPSAGWTNNQWYLSWIEMEPTKNVSGYTTSVRFAELTNGQLTEKGTLFENQGVTDQSLLGEIRDKLYMLYQVGAEGTPKLIRYNGSAWEDVENFSWSPKVENASTTQLSVSIGGNYLGAVGVTKVQTGGGNTSTSIYASTFSLYSSEAPPKIAETPWALISGIIATVVIVVLIGAIVLVRKRRAKPPRR